MLKKLRASSQIDQDGKNVSMNRSTAKPVGSSAYRFGQYPLATTGPRRNMPAAMSAARMVEIVNLGADLLGHAINIPSWWMIPTKSRSMNSSNLEGTRSSASR